MSHTSKTCLLALIISMTLIPVVGSAGTMNSGESQNASSGVNDSLSGPTPAPQHQELKYTDIAPSGGTPTLSGDSGGQASAPAPSAKREQIKVVYDQETEKDRGILITLIIAFGISLALNIYLATSLIAAKRGM